MIIGLTGYAGVGKDTVADVLVRKHGFKRLAFADPLREMLYALNPIVDRWQKDGRPEQVLRVKDLVDKHGWDQAKRLEPEIRVLLQRMGTDAGRNILGGDVWIDMAINRLEDLKYANYENMPDVVITDCRFQNEAMMIRQREDVAGYVVKVQRTGYGPVNDHVSDAGLPDSLIDYVLHNNTYLSYDPNALNITVADMLEALKC